MAHYTMQETSRGYLLYRNSVLVHSGAWMDCNTYFLRKADDFDTITYGEPPALQNVTAYEERLAHNEFAAGVGLPEFVIEREEG